MISECVIVINVVFANECHEYYEGVAKTNKKIGKGDQERSGDNGKHEVNNFIYYFISYKINCPVLSFK